ncbi:MAG: efflux RND transporter periplasmic adaptor subunit [Gemmatimonadetes bacterium]|nr:MAG: efflux RND transporter periplasmic adaptor subunit [Gemmatimonadota bacterium]
MRNTMTTNGRMRATLAVFALTAAAACGPPSPDGGDATESAAVAVRVSHPVRSTPAGSWVATVEADEHVRVATRVAGTVRAVHVDVGDRVRAGQPLVSLDDHDLRAAVRAAEARADLARRTFARIDALYADGAASQQELDAVRADLEAAEAALEAARAQLAYARLSAPFDAEVASRDVDPGDLAAPGRPLLELVSLRGRRVVADLPAAAAAGLEPGARLHVSLRDGRLLPAVVRRVAPVVDAATRTVRVEAALEGGAAPLRPGTFVRLVLPGPEEAGWWVPADALVRRGQLTGVFRVEDDTLRLRWVRTGRRAGGAVELLAGPRGVAPVVQAPSSALRDGAVAGGVTVEPWDGPGAGAAR